ncbi:alpha/beta hydrolase [Kitasatospora sp. NPDC054939]
MRSFRAARPRLLLTALATGTLLLGTACEDGARSDRSAGATAPGTAASGADRATGAGNPALKAFHGQQIAWAACPADRAAEEAGVDLSTTRCGTLRVPLDYTRPDGDTLDIALMKLPASLPDRRIGSLAINPGGPGGSGIDMLKSWAGNFGALHERFDVIGFDPRGTGASSPVDCLDDRETDALEQQDSPLDPAARKAQSEQQSAATAAGCQAKSGRLLPFVGTRNTARDLDVLRAAVGDRKLNYLGVSYGTYLGTLYAEEFPQNVGRMVLDGAVNPGEERLDKVVNQQIGFEKSFNRFAADCVRNHPQDCPLGSDPGAAAKKAADFLDGLRNAPLKASDGRRLGSDLAWTGVISALYGDESSWEWLRKGLGHAMLGNPRLLMYLADSYNGRDEKGHYDPSQEAFLAIRCADTAAPAPTAEEARAAVDRLLAEAPLLSKGVAPDDFSRAQCADWPYKTPEKPHTVRAEGADPILVVGTTGDPATPYAAAEALAKGFARANLLTLEGEGHGAFGKGNACIDAALKAYFTEGALPAAGARCS